MLTKSVKRMAVLLLAASLLVAAGANPRFLEELVIGGGPSDATDGGAEFNPDGTIATSGAISADGTITAGADTQPVAIGVIGGFPSVQSTGTPRLDVWHRPAMGNARLDIDATPQDDTADATIRVGRFTDTTGGRNIEWYAGDGSSTITANLDMASGDAWVVGDFDARGGDLDAGTDGGTRGVITAWDGSGGSVPGTIRLGSPDGTTWYLFVEDDGTLKVHAALPTANSDGTVVGIQF